MKIIITGASGYVGKQLVPLLDGKASQLLLVGRDEQKLKDMFPNLDTCHYDSLKSNAKGFDVLVHLAVANNNQNLSYEEFKLVNVGLLQDVVKIAEDCNIAKFVNISSVHALSNNPISDYAKTKKQGDEWLLEAANLNTKIYYLPYVYGETWGTRFKFLENFPNWIAHPMFGVFAALKPTVHIQKLADSILCEEDSGHRKKQILADDQDKNLLYTAVRRTIDLVFAFTILIFFSWLLLIVWFAIKIDSRGPTIFVQERVGKGGKTFNCFKFRTMHIGTKQVGTHDIDTSSVTKVGHFLRKTKLDELPQIINLFLNQMSLVGPRPCLPVQKELVKTRSNLGVFDIKPGISGHAQIQKIDMSDPIRISNVDAEYISLRGLILDLKIALATIMGSGGGDNTKNKNPQSQ